MGVDLGNTILVVDEAHNLPDRIRSGLERRITQKVFQRAHADCQEYKEELEKKEDALDIPESRALGEARKLEKQISALKSDPGLRKYMQRVNLNYEGEGTTIDANLALRYDYDDQNTPQPAKIALPSVGGAGTYGAAKYGQALYDASGVPLVRQSVEGSGFAVALQIDDQNSADSFSVKGFQLEFTPGGRR